MEKRDMENPTKFARQIKEECHIYDLQGLCKDNKGNYTIAIEAVDMGNDPIEAYIELFTEDEIFAKSCFAKRINAEFVLMMHKKEQQGDEIYLKFFKPDQTSKKAICVNEKKLSDAYFLNWWKKRKDGAQTKGYRGEMQRKILSSYFDQLLEKNGSSWTGNIDGFLMDTDEKGEGKVSALIECRFSTNEPIESYDPNRYYKSGGGDYMTWNGLVSLAKKMEIPLYLLTYSRLINSRSKVGITEIIDLDKEKGVIYYKNKKPYETIAESSKEVMDWILNH